MITALAAARAYAAAQAQTPGDPTIGAAAKPAGPDFGSILSGVMNDAVNQSKNAERQMMAGAQGKTDLVNVVTAVSSAEASLETVMAVRDQVISAYQEIMRMPM